jgi:hypothetical protein
MVTTLSCSSHNHLLTVFHYRFGGIGDVVFVLHVPPPVVFSRKGLAALSRVGAVVLGAEVFLRLGMFVVDVSV